MYWTMSFITWLIFVIAIAVHGVDIDKKHAFLFAIFVSLMALIWPVAWTLFIYREIKTRKVST